MPRSSPQPAERPAVGQLLVRLLHHFRAELLSHAATGGFPDVRLPHLQIWGNVGVDGIRLTRLAVKAQLSLAACSELVDDLVRGGYVERRPDPTDGRAKLIFPTERGRALLDAAGRQVAELEVAWGRLVGSERFEETCRVLAELLTALDDDPRPRAHA